MLFNYSFKVILLIILLIIVSLDCFTISNRKKVKEESDFDPAQSILGKHSLDKFGPCPSRIKCVPYIQCPAHVHVEARKHPELCVLPDGSRGFCCETGQNHTASTERINDFEEREMSHIIEMVANEARSFYEGELRRVVHPIPRGQPDFLHHMVFRQSPQSEARTYDLINRAMEQVFATKIYKDKEHISKEDFQYNKLFVPFADSDSREFCPIIPQCSNIHSIYRNADGTCNNPLEYRRAWGAAGQPMERLLPPYYEDGIWAPRLHSVDGSYLLSPRTISTVLFSDVNRPHPLYNLMVMQFGQFISHDFTQSASITLNDGSPIQCCTDDGSNVLPPDQLHFACLPIPIDPNDKFYRKFRQGCMNFVRSSLAPRHDCRLGYGKQLSKVTHYLDGSAIYGSDLDTQKQLREFRGGRLRMFKEFGRELLPLTNDPNSCASIAAGNACFLAGDGRVNQIISLTALHVIFAREHNKIADILAKLNPHYSDELLFQEARRIVIAEIQQITYGEWLPLIIGYNTMKRFGILLQDYGYSLDYDVDVNPAVTSEFTVAAYRFGHSTVDGKFKIHRHDLVEDSIDIPDVMFNPTRLRRQNFLDDLLRTLVEQPMQEVDNSITHGLTRFLFRGGSPFGLDLASLNIQRGRDHAVGSYNDYLEVIGYHRIESFDEFGPVIGPKLASVYRYPDDIDLWVGGLLESGLHDGLLGITFSEMIADQFSRLRRGDRYFFENDPSINPGYFTPKQLQEIRKVTMSRIICDNADHSTLNGLPLYAFILPNTAGNTIYSCNSDAIPQIDFEVFRE